MEWSPLSPHVSTQTIKSESKNNSKDHVRETTKISDPEIRRVSTSSESSTNGCDCDEGASLSSSSSTTIDGDSIISFKDLSLQHDQPISSSAVIVEKDEEVHTSSGRREMKAYTSKPILKATSTPDYLNLSASFEQEDHGFLTTRISKSRRRPTASLLRPKQKSLNQNALLSSSSSSSSLSPLLWDILEQTSLSSPPRTSSLLSSPSPLLFSKTNATFHTNDSEVVTMTNRPTLRRIQTSKLNTTTTTTSNSNINNDNKSTAKRSLQENQRLKRQRRGSVFSMMTMTTLTGNSTTTYSSCRSSASASASVITAFPIDRRKRRRLNRNRALVAHEFDTILSQINTTGSM